MTEDDLVRAVYLYNTGEYGIDDVETNLMQLNLQERKRFKKGLASSYDHYSYIFFRTTLIATRNGVML